MWKSLELPLPREIINHTSWEVITEISAIIEVLKDAGLVNPTTSQFKSPTWPLQKTSNFWRMTVDCCKLNQVVNGSCLHQMWFDCLSKLTHPLGPGRQLLIWRTHFAPDLSTRTTRCSLLSVGKANNVPSLSYLGGIISCARSSLQESWSPVPNIRQHIGLFGWWHHTDWIQWAWSSDHSKVFGELFVSPTWGIYLTNIQGASSSVKFHGPRACWETTLKGHLGDSVG